MPTKRESKKEQGSIDFFFVNLQVIKGYRDAYEARIEERAG